MGRYDEAITLFKSLIKDFPHYLDARLQLGLAYFIIKEYDKAHDSWFLVLRQEPDNRIAKFYMATIEDKE